MTVDWIHFTPWTSLAGGALIGVAASLFVLLNGRVAGISGVLGGLLRPSSGDVGWRVAFVAGLMAAPAVWLLFGALPEFTVDANNGLLVAAGLVVGVSTRYGAGCTSGHGVCGLSRFSYRSLVATASFMAAGFACVFVVRHVLAA